MIKLYCALAPRDVIKGHIRDLRPTWLLEELGIPYERIVLDPRAGETRTPEHFSRSTFGKIPAIQDGDFTLFESAAIVGYIAQKDGRLIPPAGTQERAVHDQWVFCAVSNIEPHNSRLWACDHSRAPGPATSDIRATAQAALKGYLDIFEERFRRDDYVMGQRFMAADIILTTALGYVWQCGELDRYPSTKAYVTRMRSRPAFQKAFAMNGIK